MSVVRVCCDKYMLETEDRERLSSIWPVLLNESEKYPDLPDKIVDINDLPDWLGDIRCIRIKPLHTVKFIEPEPRFSEINKPEVKEFIKNVTQVVMPGFDLLKYGAIQVLEDCCTDNIQSELDQGWRIIAVLPQHGNRRPDYIMVRVEK